jgi:hypothetical protein
LHEIGLVKFTAAEVKIEITAAAGKKAEYPERFMTPSKRKRIFNYFPVIHKRFCFPVTSQLI